MFHWLKNLFASAVARKKQDEEWAARFTNPPADNKNKLPLDPGRSDLG